MASQYPAASPNNGPTHYYQPPSQYGAGPPPPDYGSAGAQQQQHQQQQQAQYAQPVQYATAAQPVQTSYVVAQAPMLLPRGPVMTVCPNCKASIQTEVRVNAGLCAWALCAGLCFVGCWLGCCLIPFAIPECQDVEHYCPNCHVLLGRRSAFN